MAQNKSRRKCQIFNHSLRKYIVITFDYIHNVDSCRKSVTRRRLEFGLWLPFLRESQNLFAVFGDNLMFDYQRVAKFEIKHHFYAAFVNFGKKKIWYTLTYGQLWKFENFRIRGSKPKLENFPDEKNVPRFFICINNDSKWNRFSFISFDRVKNICGSWIPICPLEKSETIKIQRYKSGQNKTMILIFPYSRSPLPC